MGDRKRSNSLLLLPLLVTGVFIFSARAEKGKLKAVHSHTFPTLQTHEPTRYMIELCEPMTARIRNDLKSKGVKIGRYIPDNSWIATLENISPHEIESLGYVEAFRPFKAQWKISPVLAATLHASEHPKEFQNKLKSQDSTAESTLLSIKLVLSIFENSDMIRIRNTILSIQGTSVCGIADENRNRLITVITPVTEIEQIALIPGVQYIEKAPQGTLRNDTTRWVIQSNENRLTPIWDQGLHGENQIVGLIDGPIYEYHCAFDDTVEPGPDHRKIIAYRGTPGSNDHGTHVAGTLAGNQSPYGSYETNDGMAYAAKISFSDYFDVDASPETLYDRLQDAHFDGARIHSNSWGDDTTTDYTTWARQADEFSHDHEMDLVIFSVSNGSMLKSPENAKNPLAVGACRKAPYQDSHYSGGYGPTTDGRRKPEIYAPGQTISSARNAAGCLWSFKSGTSMASPSIAAMAALTRQYYMEGFYPTGQENSNNAFEPSGALLKATLINSAVDMANVSHQGDLYPNDKEGWGRVLLDNALFFKNDDIFLYAKDILNTTGMVTGEHQQIAIRVLSDTQPLKLTIAWTDPPPAPQAEDVIVNNLDLVVFGPGFDGPTYYGNVFDTLSGESIAGGTPDELNNLERVIFNSPSPGRYTVSVEATAINDGPQGYAMVINGDFTLCQWQHAPGDADLDGDVDLEDFAGFQACYGQGSTNNPITSECYPFDFDCNDEIDEEDTEAFVSLLTGPDAIP